MKQTKEIVVTDWNKEPIEVGKAYYHPIHGEVGITNKSERTLGGFDRNAIYFVLTESMLFPHPVKLVMEVPVYEPKVGEVGWFWDSSEHCTISTLINIDDTEPKYRNNAEVWFKNFAPLNDPPQFVKELLEKGGMK